MTAYTAHPLADLIPEMMVDELVELERDIQANGQQQPIVLYEGQILDGRHRYAVCQKLGIVPQTFEFKGAEAEARAMVLSLNVHRRHLTFEQKQKLIEVELQRDPQQSDRAIAAKAKVSPTTVGKARAKAEAAGEVSTVDTITGKDGVKQPRKPAKPEAAPKPKAAKQDTPPPRASTTTASWPRRAGPMEIAQVIVDALGDADRAMSVARCIEKQARKSRQNGAAAAQPAAPVRSEVVESAASQVGAAA